METITAVQDFEYVELSNLISKVGDLKAEGYRLVQICGVVLDDETYEILYSFDKDHLLKNLRLDVKIDVDEVESITGIYWPAFIYENEMHDLFGVQIKMINIDFEGKLYRTAIETPFK